MRGTSFLVSCALFASYASAGALWVRQAAPPACSVPCLNTGTNNVTLDGCAQTDSACLCRSATYVQGVINCLATVCSSHADVETALQYSTSFCGLAGVNSSPPGITTPASQLAPTSTGSGGSTTPAPTGASTTAPAASTTTSKPNGASVVEPRAMIAALVLAAVGIVAAV